MTFFFFFFNLSHLEVHVLQSYCCLLPVAGTVCPLVTFTIFQIWNWSLDCQNSPAHNFAHTLFLRLCTEDAYTVHLQILFIFMLAKKSVWKSNQLFDSQKCSVFPIHTITVHKLGMWDSFSVRKIRLMGKRLFKIINIYGCGLRLQTWSWQWDRIGCVISPLIFVFTCSWTHIFKSGIVSITPDATNQRLDCAGACAWDTHQIPELVRGLISC